MLPTASLYQFNSAGQTHQGILEDISTRSLQSVRIGEGAGKLQQGLANAFVGYEAGRETQQSSYLTFVGYQAGYNNIQASYGTFVGAYAGRDNEYGTANVFVGYRTGEQNKDGSQCVAIGADAMRYNDSGNNSVAVGYAAGERCLDGSFNTMIGAQAGQDNRSGDYNTMAGYRSGRSAFLGNSNTYFGAYAGYSNAYGSANCFIGFRAGESLTFGDSNIAIGAFSLANASQGSSNISIGTNAASSATGSGNVYFGQNAGTSNYNGDLNVIIGTNAGFSNQGDKNVIIGESSAPVWEGDGNVLIGAEVSHHGTGYNNVIVGYNTASDNYRTGSNNIFIGTGSDATRSNVGNAISIGTCNVTTTSDSIAVGKNIENTGINSVSLGFSINTNAQNSVLVGEALNITSATYFNDPLNIEIIALIQSDALLKFGISNILYDNGILGTLDSPYATAEFGYNTSNHYNSSTNPIRRRISPTSFLLADQMGYHARIQGCNLFYTDTSFELSNATPVQLTASNTSVFFFQTPLPERAPTITATSNFPLMTYASTKHRFPTHLSFINDTSNAFIQNVFSCNNYERDYTVRILKHARQPYIQTSLNLNDPAFSFEWRYETSLDSNLPSFSPSTSNWVVIECPRFGRFNRVSAPPTDWATPTDVATDYTMIPTAVFATYDTCGLLAAESYYDAASNLYGISSNVVEKVRIPTPTTPSFYATSQLYSDSNSTTQPWYVSPSWFMAIQYGDWAFASNVVLQSFDDRFRFYSNATDTYYRSNQNLTVPETIVYAIDTDSNIPKILFPGSNDPLYIGNTYIFQQFAPSNLLYPMRFSAEPDGQNDSDFIDDTLTYAGTPGIDGTITLLVTSNTPNPLYYYTSNQVGWGGSNSIQPLPMTPVQFPYSEIIYQSNAFYWFGEDSNPSTWNGETLTEPFAFSISFSNVTCNIQIPLYATHSALWEDSAPSASTDLYLSTPYSSYAGPNKPASNIYIEQYPTHGLFQSASNIQNLNTYTYRPLNPWDATDDHASFFLENTTDATFKRFSFSWRIHPVQYQTSNHWTKLPTTITELSSNATYIGSNEYTSNIYHYTISNCNIQPLPPLPPIVFPETVSETPIVSYDPITDAQKWIYSNVTVLHRWEILPSEGSNLTIYIDNVSNIDILLDTTTSNIDAYSNVTSIPTGTVGNPQSNHVIETIAIHTTTHRRVYDSNYTVETAWHDTSNYYDAPRSLFLYQTEAVYPKNTTVLTSAPELGAGASVQTFLTSNYQLNRIYDERRGFHPLVQSALYYSNTHLWLDAASDFWLIESNVGRVSVAHASNLRNNDPPRLWLDAKIHWETTTPIAPNPSVFRFHIDSPSTPLLSYQVPYHRWSASLAPSPYLRETLADYRNRTGTQWWEMTTELNSTASTFGAWETSVRPTSFAPTHLYVVYLQRGFLRHSTGTQTVHRIPLNQISEYTYQATGRYESDTLEWYYANETTGRLSALTRQTVFLRHLPELRNRDYAVSHKLARWNPWTSNAFYATVPETASSNLYVRFDTKSGGSPLDIHRWPTKVSDPLAIYALSEFESSSLYASIKTMEIARSLQTTTEHTVTYTLYGSQLNATLALNPLDDGQWTIPLLPFYDFPQTTASNATLESLRINTPTTHSNQFYGAASNHLSTLIDANGTRSLNLRFVRTNELQHGRLTKDVFDENDIASHAIDVIPYDPMAVSNEPLTVQWIYDNAVRSPNYRWNLKPYWFIPSPQPIVPYRETVAGRSYNLLDPGRSIVSQGFLDDVANGTITLTAEHTYPYHSNTTASNLTSVLVTFPNQSYILPLVEIPVAYSFPPQSVYAPQHLYVEQAGSVSLMSLLTALPTYDDTQSYNLYLYVDTPPLHGLLRHESNAEVGAWSRTDLLDVTYQHLGSNTLTDTFTIRFGTHPYDVTLAPVPVIVHVELLPRLLSDREDFIYATSQSNALAGLYGLNRTLVFESQTGTTNSGYIHTLFQSNIETVWWNQTCNSISIDDLNGGTASNTGYRLHPDYFNTVSNEPLSLRFAISSKADPNAVHRLTYEPMYSNLIVYDWSGQFNTLASSNTLVAPFLASNSQKIEYDFQVNHPNYQNLSTLETSFSFLVQPYNELVESVFLTPAARELYQDYFNPRFRVEFLGSNETPLCDVIITYQAITLQQTTLPIPPTIQSTLVFNQYSLWTLVFNDGANRGFTSIYVNPNLFLSNRDNQTHNILANQSIPITLQQLTRIRILSYADDAFNYTDFIRNTSLYPSSSPPIYKTLQLDKASHRLYFKNVELSSKLATQDAIDVLSDTYNIALGKNIQVKGEDNICLGTNFSTLGKYSIIIGNNIGQSVNFVNQVYQSIIIGNTSFQDSIIRNVTAIGSGLMNNLYAGALPNLTDQIINQFISKRPILIGNDIGPEKVDYHINVANTVMRTSVGNTSNYDQIYLGNEQEIVAIGYTSNESLQGPAKLYVKGDLQCDGVKIPFQTGSVNGGTVTLSLNTFTRGRIDLLASGSPPALTLQFQSLESHVGKEIEIVLREMSAIPRPLTLDSMLKFATTRPTATTPNSIDRLRFTVIDSNVALATYTADFRY